MLNTAPAEDYTSGSIPGSPDAPAWPAAFRQVVIHSADGAPLLGEVALHPGRHPGVLVVHGFNTHGIASVVRWAAMLSANGYDVAAFDQRDFSFEYRQGYGSPDWLQTFGWKESQDVLAAGRYLAAQTGVRSVGILGFSEGAQNTILALSLDATIGTPCLRSRADVQRTCGPGHADLLDGRPARLLVPGVHLSGNRCARRSGRAALRRS